MKTKLQTRLLVWAASFPLRTITARQGIRLCSLVVVARFDLSSCQFLEFHICLHVYSGL